jgi:hypothetical protein
MRGFRKGKAGGTTHGLVRGALTRTQQKGRRRGEARGGGMVGEAAQPWPGDGAAEVEDTPDRWVPPVGDRRERERGGPQERGKWARLVWWAGWREQKRRD